MPFGAGFAAVRDLPDVDIVDPRVSAAPDIAAIYRKFPHIGMVLPAMGYSDQQRQSLAHTINRSAADIVVAATPANISRVLEIKKPVVRVSYEYEDAGADTLSEAVDGFLDRRGL